MKRLVRSCAVYWANCISAISCSCSFLRRNSWIARESCSAHQTLFIIYTSPDVIRQQLGEISEMLPLVRPQWTSFWKRKRRLTTFRSSFSDNWTTYYAIRPPRLIDSALARYKCTFCIGICNEKACFDCGWNNRHEDRSALSSFGKYLSDHCQGLAVGGGARISAMPIKISSWLRRKCTWLAGVSVGIRSVLMINLALHVTCRFSSC